MKLLFIYLAVVLAIVFYLWFNIIKEGNQTDDMTSINKLLASKFTMNSDTNIKGGPEKIDTNTNILTSNAVSNGITSIDRYADPKCKATEHIYCVDGQIECQDIFGDKIKDALQNPIGSYLSGNTFAGTCGSNIDKPTLLEYSTQIGTDFTKTSGVYFDISNCGKEKPWRVGNYTTTNSKNQCFSTQSDADNVWNKIVNESLNTNATYKINDQVFILASYILGKSTPQNKITNLLAIIDNNKVGSQKSYTTINNQKYYYAQIDAITGNTYTVSIPNSPIIVSKVEKNNLLKNSLYNSKTNDYYSNLTSGKYPRPVCKSGAFTSCSSSPPFKIENGIYISTVSENNTINMDSSYNKYRVQSQIDLNNHIPFSAPPINPSGLIDKSNFLLDYNYFRSDITGTPFIKCNANYNSKIGDPLCCNQPGTVTDTKNICPQEIPKCKGYSSVDSTFGYCSQ
jgi:hypothetical protein